MAAKMTEAEYKAFKEKSGHKETQKVTTHYAEAKKHDDGVKHHEERRELNRSLRDKQRTPAQKVERGYNKVKGFLGPVVSSVRGRLSTIHPPKTDIRDFMPSQRGDPFSMGFGGMGPVSDPRKTVQRHHPAPAPRKKKSRRRPAEVQEQPFDYLSHLHNLPWK